MTIVAGVDGCRAGWVAATFDLQVESCSLAVHGSFAELMEALKETDVIAVDIPIGLSDSGPRPADRSAREALGPRSSSVFPAPCRASLGGTSYEAASALSFEASGKKLTKQTYAIIKKIREVDDALYADLTLLGRVVEVHPEVSFAVLNGGRPMAHTKKRTSGRHERFALLPVQYQSAFTAFRPKWLHKHVGTDDILDALAALWTAVRVHAGTARSFPPTPVVQDSFGLPMQILA